MGINCNSYEATLPEFDALFAAHVAELGLSFPTTESYNFRKATFALRDAEINAINSISENTWEAGHNFLSTLTPDERKQWTGKLQRPADIKIVENPLTQPAAATSVDWRTKGAVNPVQNQGQCGSCWAFSSTAAMEGSHFINAGKLLKLSEQQLVDCDPKSDGCNGGLEMYAFEYLAKHKQESESSYPYKGRTNRCRYRKHHGLVEATSYVHVPKRSVPDLMAAVEAQPTCVSVDAAGAAFQSYKGGILSSTTCGTDLDHAVTAVGYGVESGTKYLIVRNSWTANWGEKGYIRMSLEVTGDGVCGVLLDSTRPTAN